MTTTRPDRLAVESALRRVLGSACFEHAGRHRQFLQFVVNEHLEGRGARLKGYTIAVAVFDKPEDFDSQADPLVRVEAGRLRQRLAQYYATEGRGDPVQIVIPKGSYQPEFVVTAASAGAADRAEDPAQPPGADAGADTVADTGADAGSPANPPAGDALRRQQGRRRRRRRLLSAAVLALLLVSAVLLRNAWRGGAPDDASPMAGAGLPDWPSIHVSPLSSLGDDPSLAFFARGIGEEIMLSLREYELIVIAGDLTGTDPDGPARLRELRSRYDVDYALSGSVRNDGERVRIVARLTDTATGEVLWSGDTDAALDVGSLIAIEERMAQEIVRAIAGPYGPIYEREYANLTRSRPRALETYNCLLRLYDYRRTVDATRIPTVTACFEEAVRAEPENADAWAGLSLMLQDGLLYGPEPEAPGEILARAREAALRGLDVNGNSVLAHQAMQRARFLEGDIDGFLSNLDRLIDLAPTDPSILQSQSQFLIMIGEIERGAALFENAARLDVNPSIHRYITETLLHLSRGDYAAARAAAVRIDAPNWYASHLFVAIAAALDGEEAMAGRAASQLLELRPGFANEARGVFETFHLYPELRERMLEGLRLAGIDVV